MPYNYGSYYIITISANFSFYLYYIADFIGI